MKELERTFLAKIIPEGLSKCRHKEVIDKYIPKEARHPVVRIRQNGDKYEITKKELIDNDPSHAHEQTIELTKEEFDSLMKLDGRIVHKTRYHYNFKDRVAEIDVFQGELLGLVIVDFEFDTMKEKDSFEMPDFCLVDITPEEFIAGGFICGKSYLDVGEDLKRFEYKKLFMD